MITFPVGVSLLQLGELLTTLAMARAGNSHSDTAVAITSLVATPTDPHRQTNEFEVLRTAAPRAELDNGEAKRNANAVCHGETGLET